MDHSVTFIYESRWYLEVISFKDQSSRGLVVGEPVAVLFNVGRAPAQVEDLLEEGSVVARPIRLTGQYIRDVISSDVTFIWIRIVSLSHMTF